MSHVSSCWSLLKATELRDRPRGSSVGFFGVTVVGGAGLAQGCWGALPEVDARGVLARDSPVTFPIPSLTIVRSGRLLFCSFSSQQQLPRCSGLESGWCRSRCCMRPPPLGDRHHFAALSWWQTSFCCVLWHPISLSWTDETGNMEKKKKNGHLSIALK